MRDWLDGTGVQAFTGTDGSREYYWHVVEAEGQVDLCGTWTKLEDPLIVEVEIPGCKKVRLTIQWGQPSPEASDARLRYCRENGIDRKWIEKARQVANESNSA